MLTIFCVHSLQNKIYVLLSIEVEVAKALYDWRIKIDPDSGRSFPVVSACFRWFQVVLARVKLTLISYIPQIPFTDLWFQLLHKFISKACSSVNI